MIYAVDSANNASDLKFFFQDNQIDIIMLHECAGIIELYLEIAPAEKKIFFIVNFSWYVSDEKAIVMSRYFKNTREKFLRGFDLFERLIILTNSLDEYERFKWFLPEAVIENVNNSFSLSEETFFLEDGFLDSDKKFDCIYNAKPLAFKRHYLTQALANKVFVSYGENGFRSDPNYVDLRRHNPSAIHWDISNEKVRELINSSVCGLILSDIEGACYASTEYLLCGIPVVSTKSFGGRDEYFSSENSMVVGSGAKVIRSAIDDFVCKDRSGLVDRIAIREGAVQKQRDFRKKLAIAISSLTGLSESAVYDYICQEIRSDSKLYSKINYWTASIRVSD